MVSFYLKLYSKFSDFFLEKRHEIFLEKYNAYIESTYNGKRGPMNFIDNFLEFTKDAESPRAFFQWSAIAAIAATMRDNIYLIGNAGRKIYPNLYVILVARSGACRKGLPLNVTEGLLSKVKNTKLIKGRASIQGVIKELAETRTMQTAGGNGFMLKGASGILYSEELAGFLVEDKSTIPLLTDLYDFHDEWENTLKTVDREKLTNVCLTMLAASNETFLKEVYQSNAIYGGLLARTCVVLEQKRHKRVLGLSAANKLPDPNPLIMHLRKVSGIQGVMIPEDCGQSREEYNELSNGEVESTFIPGCGHCAVCEMGKWYYGIDDSKYESKSGIEARIHTTIQKVAMCLAMAEPKCELIVKGKHIVEAIDLCCGLLKNYEFLTMTSSTSAIAQPAALVIRLLANAPNYTLSMLKIQRELVFEVEAKTLKSVLDHLITNKVLEYEANVGKDGVGYKLSADIVEKYAKKKSELKEKK